MPAQDDDDYVVSLLLKDAEANKKRYLSNSGLGSLLSKKPCGNAPKPNTRFLRNIVKEADNHNAALKAREEEESRARLSDLKRKREDEDRGENSGRKRVREDRPGRWASALGGLSNKPGKEEDRSRHRDRRREKSRERQPDRRHQRRRDVSERSRSRSRSPPHRKERRRRSRSRTPPRHKSEDSDRSSESDPLETILGPKPPPTILPRGRGAHKSFTANGSNIDDRFSASYNPKTDVGLDEDEAEGDDWDMALEALKDRAKWRAQGAERLRQAGFTEKEVERWEGSAAFPNGGKDGEKDIGDVKWSKRGEGREWDRGKVADGESMELKPMWARAKE